VIILIVISYKRSLAIHLEFIN